MSITSRIAVVALLALAVTGLTPAGGGARDAVPDVAPRVTGPQEADVLGIVVDPRSRVPTMMLQGRRDRRSVAMSIDPAQVIAISLPLQGVTPSRPLTHDLFLTLFGRLNVRLTRVVITDFRDDVYYATLHLTGAAGDITLDARPSDAVALAIRARVPVLVEDRVFDKGPHI
jgi:bifunctional DNase/RNase